MTAFASRISAFVASMLLVMSVGAVEPYLIDGDGDLVSDEIDDCPYTHPGSQVGANGCLLRSNDADLDGKADDVDDCPYSPKGAVIDARGCSLDSDFDGVANGIDRCPRTVLAAVTDAKGCAKGEIATAVAPSRAAPAQRQLPVGAQAASASAPIIAQPVKAAVPSVSAPTAATTAETPELMVNFGYGSHRLGVGDMAAIKAYARVFARRLTKNPGSKLHLQAFADKRETDAKVVALARMTAVRSVLEMQGIALDRIRTDNSLLDTDDASANRRVVARLDN